MEPGPCPVAGSRAPWGCFLIGNFNFQMSQMRSTREDCVEGRGVAVGLGRTRRCGVPVIVKLSPDVLGARPPRL